MDRRLERFAAPRRIVLSGALATLGARGVRAQVQSDTTADLILRNGQVLTVDAAFSKAQAVAIAGNRILAVGDNAAMGRFTGKTTRVIDLKGATVVPGLRDSHLHTLGVARDIFNVDLQDARSIAEIQQALATRVAQTPKGEWVIGSSGWHEGQIRERRMPTRQELDAVSPNNPVFIPRGGHVALANSAALALAGISRDTPDPKGGNIVRDGAGDPTGMLVEGPAMILVRRLLPQTGRDKLVEGLKRFSAILATLGITATTEPGATPDEIGAYMDLWRQKGMKHRVRIMQRVGGLADVKARSAVIAPNFGDDWLRIGGFKALFDGGVEAARLSTPYRIVPGEQTDPAFLGQYLLPPGGDDEAQAMFELAAERGWQFQVHAVGDATIDRLVGIWEKVAAKHDIAAMRWAVLHCMLGSDSALDRIKKLGVRVTVQDQSVRLASNMIRYWGEERAGYCTPVRAILDKGIPTGAGTDAPVAHWNPFQALWWMVTRQVEIGGEITKPLGPQQAVSRIEALRLYTMGSADVDFMEDRAGSIAPGKLADLAVLSDDYLTVPADGIRRLRSLLTIVDGQISHEA
jgi:predicted amidohydrolase YtcJ